MLPASLYPKLTVAIGRAAACLIVCALLGVPLHPTAASSVSRPPNVAIALPFEGQFFEPGTNTLVSALAGDLDGFVVQVDFYVDGALRFRDAEAAYEFTYGDIAPGNHAIWAVATDDSGLMNTSQVVHVSSAFPPGVAPIVPNGSVWRYLDTGANLGTEWRRPFFNDSIWPTGAGELGYGDAEEDSRPEATVTGFGPDPLAKYPTTYFRRTFFVPNPGAFTNLVLRILCDDGCLVYLNGREVARQNMEPGGVRFDTFASGPAPDDGATFVPYTVNPAMLVAGPNVLAVEVHQESPASPDLSFDLMLLGQQGPQPSDCNSNGTDDATDIANGTSYDANGDTVPDECQASIALVQQSFTDAEGNFVQRYSKHGVVRVRAIQPPEGKLAWFNLAFNGRWVVQNLPLQGKDCAGLFHDYSAGFSLDGDIGTPSPPGIVSWELTPEPQNTPPSQPPVTMSLPEKTTAASTTAGFTGDPFGPYVPSGIPSDFVLAPAPETTMTVSRSGVPSVDEEVNHCGPGAGARCLGWMSDKYCLGLTNAQSLYDKLKNTDHMMTTLTNGTYYSKIAPALLSCLQSNGVSGYTAAYCPTNSPSDLVTSLKSGKDVIMLMGWCGEVYTTNMDGSITTNIARVGGHIVVATGATMKTNGDTTIDFQDDVFGDTDNQGDGKADDGKTRTAKVESNGAGGWNINGFGAEAKFEGFVKVCPSVESIITSIVKNVLGSFTSPIEGLRPRMERYLAGDPPTAEELNQLNAWSCVVQEDSGFLFNTLQQEGAPPLALLMADQSATWSRQLRGLMVDFVRSPINNSGSLPQMVQLAVQIEDAVARANLCLLDPVACQPPQQPRLQITRLDDLTATLEWEPPGVLQTATDVLGPWADLPDSSPTTISLSAPHAFYRVEVPAGDQGCLHGVKGLISGDCPLPNFICIQPCLAGGACPTPPTDNGVSYLSVVNADGDEICRIEVSPTVPCTSCEVQGRFTVQRAQWVDPAAGTIRFP